MTLPSSSLSTASIRNQMFLCENENKTCNNLYDRALLHTPNSARLCQLPSSPSQWSCGRWRRTMWRDVGIAFDHPVSTPPLHCTTITTPTHFGPDPAGPCDMPHAMLDLINSFTPSRCRWAQKTRPNHVSDVALAKLAPNMYLKMSHSGGGRWLAKNKNYRNSVAIGNVFAPSWLPYQI